MDIQGQVVMDRALLGAMVRAAIRRLTLLRVMGGLVVLFTTTALVFSSENNGLQFVVLVCGAFLLFLPELTMLFGWRRIRPLRGQPWTYRVTDETIEQVTPLLTASFPWNTVTAVRETTQVLALRTKLGTTMAVPKRAFTADDLERLRAHVRDLGVVAA